MPASLTMRQLTSGNAQEPGVLGSAGPAGLPGLGAFNRANLGRQLMSSFQGLGLYSLFSDSWIEAGCREL